MQLGTGCASLRPDSAVPRSQSVVLHTNYGDIKLEVFCEEVPKTAYNFMALAASGAAGGGGAVLMPCGTAPCGTALGINTLAC